MSKMENLGLKRGAIAGIKCNGCNYTYDWFSLNDAGSGIYYCGGCNLGTGITSTPATNPINITFTSTHKTEEKPKEEKPPLKPAEEQKESKEEEKDEDDMGLVDLFDEKKHKLDDEAKDQEANIYFNNIAFKAWLKKYKGLTTLPFHVFRYDLNVMGRYFNEYQEWRNNTGIPKPSK